MISLIRLLGIFVGVLVLLVGFIFILNQPTPAAAPAPSDSAEQETPTSVSLSDTRVVQGGTLVVEMQGDIDQLLLDGQSVSFAAVGDMQVAVLGFDTRAPLGERILTYVAHGERSDLPFSVVEKAYPITRIVVPPDLADEGVTSGDLAESIAQSDNVTLNEIIATETETYHFATPFQAPVDQWIDVGGFGNVREDQYGSIRHLGVDLDGDTGDPVYATNRGVVVFAGDLQNYGNSIVIDHGVGIFSIYLHLAAVQTESSATVAAGEQIGLVGNTGAYTLEPHLHFSLKVHGTSVDPRIFIDTFNETL